MKRVKFLGFNVWIPNHWFLRTTMGVLLIIGSIFSFLPVLGIWMLPLGLIILSIDFPMVRRFRRNATVRLGIYFVGKLPRLARRLGFSTLRSSR